MGILSLMNPQSAPHRGLTLLFLLAFAFSLPGTLSLAPSAEAASSSASARIIKKLKKQIATLKAQLAAATATPAPFIEMVTVGNAGNAADPSDGDQVAAGTQSFGAVPYEFQIGKIEVTLAQYTAFLNAVAATDTFELYDADMGTNPIVLGISQSGTSGSFTYSVIGTGTRPVQFVNWFDAARFCNWLHNGRPTGMQTAGTTERGAYTLDGAVSGGGFVVNRGAKFWIPSEDEWYKAAFHQPAGQGGDADNYWLYPTKSNLAPTVEAPPGSSSSANYSNAVGAPVPGGSYTGSAGFYGTFDQGGNVFEWNDGAGIGSLRCVRGGNYANTEVNLSASNRLGVDPTLSGAGLGFRVASP